MWVTKTKSMNDRRVAVNPQKVKLRLLEALGLHLRNEFGTVSDPVFIE